MAEWDSASNPKGLLEKLRNISQRVDDATVNGFDAGAAQSKGNDGKGPERNDQNVSQNENVGEPKHPVRLSFRSPNLVSVSAFINSATGYRNNAGKDNARDKDT